MVQDEKKNRDAIPSILSDALAVSFDNNIGHDYLFNYEERYEYYHRKEEKSPSTLSISTKSLKVVYLLRLLTSRLLVRVSASLYSCAMLLNFRAAQGRNVLLYYNGDGRRKDC